MAESLWRQVRETADMIKVAHSVFALPFALGAAALALRAEGGWAWRPVVWIVVCAVAARTAAMAMNRWADAGLDAANPRTAGRALPAGRVSRRFVLGLVALSSAVFVFGAWRLNPLVFALSPVALAVLLAYPYTKRFTALCHVWLGAALGLSPVGAWLAVRGSWAEPATPLLFGGAVLLWTAGFDLIYACQDEAHDRAAGLFSMPAWLGVRGALRAARGFHVAAVALLVAAGVANPHLGWVYGAGVAGAAALLVYEHAIVAPDDLSRIDVAFFTLNGAVSLVLGGAIVADAFV